MKKIALASLVLGVISAAPSAFAQCPPGSWLCADIQIGTAPPPPPPVYVQPVPPPPVYVQPPPPVVVVQPPRIYVAPPPRVYVAPPPVVVYQPQQPMYVQPPQTYAAGYMATQPRRGYLGVQGQLAGALVGANPAASSGVAGVGGAGLGLRFRSQDVLGGELAFNVMGGSDYNHDSRVEVPVTASALFYFNPQNRFQVYGLAGLGASIANVRYNSTNRVTHGRAQGDYTYFGGQLGIGAEFQLSQRFSLWADARGYVRTRVDDEARSNPEFSRNISNGTASPTTQTTNTSGGVAFQLGAVLYF